MWLVFTLIVMCLVTYIIIIKNELSRIKNGSEEDAFIAKKMQEKDAYFLKQFEKYGVKWQIENQNYFDNYFDNFDI